MITLTRQGDTIKFTFSGNPLYLNDGVIEAPLNSLTLVTDTSGIATFKKSATNDIFVCASYDELGMTKAELETWFKNNAVGGGGGMPSGDVQTMIDQSISGFADNASYDSVSQEIKFYNGNTEVYSVDASDFVIDGMIDDVRIETISGVTYLVIDFNTASGKEDIQIPLTDIFDPSNYYTKTEVDQALSGKADSSSVYSKSEVDNAISAATDDMATQTWVGQQGYQTSGDVQNAISGKADTTAVTASIEAATSGKVDSNSVVTAVTSGSTDSEIPTAKAVYDATQGGGGKAISAGTNISVTTGETADTVSCTLPISGDSKGIYTTTAYPFLSTSTKMGNVVFGDNNIIDTFGSSNSSNYNLFFGKNNIVQRNCSCMLWGGSNNTEARPSRTTLSSCVVLGYNNKIGNDYETVIGRYNVSLYSSSSFGNSGNTLFSVGNGTSDNARHNAFEIRQNGDIYISSGGTDIKLQDNLGSSIEVSSAITSGDTNAVAGGAVYDKFDEVEQVTARAIIDVNDKFGGLKLQKITQSAYDALSGNTDSNTLYVIVN